MLANLKKRVKLSGARSGTTKFTVPFDADDEYGSVTTAEARPHKSGRYTGSTVDTSSRTVLTPTLERWLDATTWGPINSSFYALEPDGTTFNAALVDRPVMGWSYGVEGLPKDSMPGGQTKQRKKKNRQSQRSKRPNVVWKDRYRSEYLDELCRLDGRGDFIDSDQCLDCVSRQTPEPGKAIYRCRSGCFLPDLTCKSCCLRRHSTHPFHWIERWTGTHFVKETLESMGLKVQLNHTSTQKCPHSVPCHSLLVVLHTNGIHKVSIHYCKCNSSIPEHLQLLRQRLYPASQVNVRTCVTFELLELLHKFALTSKSATYDFYRALEKMTDATGLATPKPKYRVLLRVVLQWRHLMLLKRAGYAHDPSGVENTEPGRAALLCPSCPWPGINLPRNWKDAPNELKFLYTAFLCMDANFRLKNQKVSNYSQDPGLGIGLAYMVPRKEYEAYVLSKASDSDISTCVGFQAIAQANNRFSVGLRYTGVGGAFCGCSEMILPLGIGNLQKGERYANMDYVFASALQAYLMMAHVLISYDIACQWFVNLFSRFQSSDWPASLNTPPSTLKLTPAIPKLHEPMHEGKNHQQYSLNFIVGAGMTDFETPERVWSSHNPLGNGTKTQGPGSRHDVLDDHFGWWNWLKIISMGATFVRKYKAAVAERNNQKESHRGFTDNIDKTLVAKWETMCTAWEKAEYPKAAAVNPYSNDGAEISSKADTRKELAKAEDQRQALGGKVLHTTSASAFIIMGLEIEDSQRRIHRMTTVKSTESSRSETSLTEQRSHLRSRIWAWELLLPIYMPRLLQHQQDHQITSSEDDSDAANGPENHMLWLPSQLPNDVRTSICSPDLIEAEEKLRSSQCSDSLSNLRHILKIKARLCHFKAKNSRGQREGTRSRAIIDRVHDRARNAAVKYRCARAAKLKLSGSGDWEKAFQVLKDADIHTYSEAKLKVRIGHRGTDEDGVVNGEQMISDITDDFSRVEEERERRDGTGETRKELSWIWVAPSGKDDLIIDDGDQILRVEWAKSRARVARATEEVQLLQEEMRRTLKFLSWRQNEWLKRVDGRETGDRALSEGLSAYGHKQAKIYAGLEAKFCTLWCAPLDVPDSDLDDDEGQEVGDKEDEDDDGDSDEVEEAM